MVVMMKQMVMVNGCDDCRLWGSNMVWVKTSKINRSVGKIRVIDLKVMVMVVFDGGFVDCWCR